jgi:hypothetical protein
MEGRDESDWAAQGEIPTSELTRLMTGSTGQRMT